MEKIYIDSNGYPKRKVFSITPQQGVHMEIMWEHCTAGFHNPNSICDTKTQRSVLTAIFKAHNTEAYFTGTPK
jgi:hypothetical protein